MRSISSSTPEREDRTVLVVPLEFVDGETPLIVSLHGYGGNSADHATYLPLHERVNTDGFGLLLPNGMFDAEGNRSWNPTDRCCQYGKTGEDDVSYLTDLVGKRARRGLGFRSRVLFRILQRRVYVLPHRLQGPSRPSCGGQPSRYELRRRLQLRGCTARFGVTHSRYRRTSVILFEGDEGETAPGGAGEPAFYAGAHDMLRRWSRAGRLRVARRRLNLMGSSIWTSTCRAPKPMRSAWKRAAPREWKSSSGRARAVAIPLTTAIHS